MMENICQIRFSRLIGLRSFRGPSSFGCDTGSILDFRCFHLLNVSWICCCVFSYCFAKVCFVYCLFNFIIINWYIEWSWFSYKWWYCFMVFISELGSEVLLYFIKLIFFVDYSLTYLVVNNCVASFQWYLNCFTTLNMATDWFSFCIMFVISSISFCFQFLTPIIKHV